MSRPTLGWPQLASKKPARVCGPAFCWLPVPLDLDAVCLYRMTALAKQSSVHCLNEKTGLSWPACWFELCDCLKAFQCFKFYLLAILVGCTRLQYPDLVRLAVGRKGQLFTCVC